MTPDAERKRIRVVVVDDQLLVREGLRRLFDATGDFEMVGECADGDEVVATVVAPAPKASCSRNPSVGIDGLTDREVEVLRCMAIGRTNREIADELFISERTVKTHIGHVFTKLEVRDRVAAVLRAYEAGLVERPSR